ncbi:MAG: cyclic nucleotide-binding domain-containing protein [Treponema sp.]|jgi:CRP-like cAMP-binding protein|nr:cyclic nucleotide-binding domain-containing protein [Treponema sp.]
MIVPSALQKYSLFGGLFEEQIKRILPLMEQEEYRKGEDIIVEGAPNDKIRFIISGRVAVLVNGMTIYEIGEGETFGEMEVLDVMASAATIRTLEPTSVISISNRGLRSVYKEDIHSFSLIIMNLARNLSRRLRHMDDKITEELKTVMQDEPPA